VFNSNNLNFNLVTPETTPELDRIISTKFILAPKLNLSQIKYESSTDSISFKVKFKLYL
jgi:hypothetical protein